MNTNTSVTTHGGMIVRRPGFKETESEYSRRLNKDYELRLIETEYQKAEIWIQAFKDVNIYGRVKIVQYFFACDSSISYLKLVDNLKKNKYFDIAVINESKIPSEDNYGRLHLKTKYDCDLY